MKEKGTEKGKQSKVRQWLSVKRNRWTALGAVLCVCAAVFFLLGMALGLFGTKGEITLDTVKEGSPEAVQKEDSRKEVLTVYADDITGAFNPAFAQSYGDRTVSQIVFEPLMKRDADGTLVPNLIKKLTVSEDGLTYTIKLKKKILFSDGSEMKAADVRASIAAMAVGGGSKAAGVYERIEGMKEFLSNPVQMPSGLTVEDDQTVQIRFTEASPDNLLVMETQVQKGDFAEVLEDGRLLSALQERSQGGIGTGAYEITENLSGSLASLKAGSHYREKIQDIKRIEFVSLNYYDIPEAVQRGELDAALYSGASQLFDTFYNWDGFTVYSKPSDLVYAMFYNQDNPLLQNQTLRQAIACAFDKESAVKQLSRYLMVNGGIPLDTSAWKAEPEYAYDPVRAEELLETARGELPGLTENTVFKLPVLKDNEVHEILAEALKKDLAAIGLTVLPEELSQQEYMQTLYLKMDFDLYLAGVTMDEYSSAYKNFLQDQNGLPIGVADSRLNRAYEELARSVSQAEIKEKTTELNRVIGQVQPALIIGRGRSFLSVSADLSGFEATPYPSLMDHIYSVRVK